MFKRKVGGSKAFWTMLKKTALFSHDGFPYCPHLRHGVWSKVWCSPLIFHHCSNLSKHPSSQQCPRANVTMAYLWISLFIWDQCPIPLGDHMVIIWWPLFDHFWWLFCEKKVTPSLLTSGTPLLIIWIVDLATPLSIVPLAIFLLKIPFPCTHFIQDYG